MHECLVLHRDTLDARRRTHGDAREEASRGYHPRRCGCYDNSEDRSPSPDLSRHQAFDRHILIAVFPPRYRPPTNILKYSRETNPVLWLEDYRLACQADGADSDDFIICNLPLFLANSARKWLEHLPPNRIQSWADMKEIFVGNF